MLPNFQISWMLLEGRLIREPTILDNFLINSWGVDLYASMYGKDNR